MTSLQDVWPNSDLSLIEMMSIKMNYFFCRHEFYQKPGEVVVTIFAKGIPATGVLVDFGEQLVRLHRSINSFCIHMDLLSVFNSLVLSIF